MMDHLDTPVSPDNTPVENPGRRKLLKVLAAGGGAIAASSLLPGEWVKPVIEVGHLPAHAQASPPIEPTVTPTQEPIVYSISCTANPTSGDTTLVEDITATVLATGGASVNNIEVQYIAETIPPGQSTSPVSDFTDSSGVRNLGTFVFCQSGLPSNEVVSYRIVISFVNQATYGNDTCELGSYTSFGC